MGHPALRPPGRPRPFRLAQNKKIIRRGGIYPARRRSRRRRVPGTMRASSPTEVCYNVGMSFPGWPRHLPLAVGADSISARGRSRRRGVRRDGASRPTAARIDAAIPVCRALAVGRRGGIYPARRRSRRRGVCGTMRASSPTEVCYNVGMSFPGWPRAPVRFVGEGHGPPAEPCAAANRADISGLRAGPAVFGLRNAPAGAVESAPTGVVISRDPALSRVGRPQKMKKFLIPHSLPVPNFKSTPSSAAPCRSRRRHRRR